MNEFKFRPLNAGAESEEKEACGRMCILLDALENYINVNIIEEGLITSSIYNLKLRTIQMINDSGYKVKKGNYGYIINVD